MLTHAPEGMPGRRALSAVAGKLAQAFPWFDFETMMTSHGFSLSARRRNLAEPGLSTVITHRPAEMLAALEQDQLRAIEHPVTDPDG